MPKIKVSSVKNVKADDFIQVRLKDGEAPKPFNKKAKLVPEGKNSVSLMVNKENFRFYQEAGRSLCNLGINDALIDSGDIPLSVLDAVWLIQGMYDGKSDINVAFSLMKKDCDKVAKISDLIADFRKLADSDSKTTTPESLVKEVFSKVKKAADKKGGEATLKLIKKGHKDYHDCVGLQAVGRGSDSLPCLGIIDYFPEGKKDDDIEISLVGKGITFDSGGYDIKPPSYMSSMHSDKSGAVYLGGALSLAILQGLKKRVRLYLCCAENMLSGSSMLPGDIISYPNGVKVEIGNTDAEGRLVLADGLIHACKAKSKFILDAATLTGAAKVAVGREMCAAFTPSNELPLDLQNAFKDSMEELWLLPMRPYFKRFILSKRADISNSGSGDGNPGASSAAEFLHCFVEKDIPWVHLDLACAYQKEGSAFYAPGATGATILSIAQFLSGKKY